MYNKNLVHYIVVTGVLINPQGKYLITKRADWEKAFPGKWTFPGGKLEVLDYALEKKDTSEHWYNVLENVLKREIREEIGLEIKNIGYVASMVYIRPDGVPCLIINLSAEPKEETSDINLCDALTDFAWVDLKEAKDFDLIEGIYEELEVFDKRLKTGQSKEWTKNPENL